MFTGIVETIGLISQLGIDQAGKHFSITPLLPFADLILGESIAVNGVCLTVTQMTASSFNVTAVAETLRKTNLSALKLHDKVNLERSLKAGDRMGGHYVQGHVDGLGEIVEIQDDELTTEKKSVLRSPLLVKISLPEHLAKYVVAKGFIALDGMSITVIKAESTWLTVTFIPHTQDVTIAHQYKKGDFLNLEVDMMGKHIEKLLGGFVHALSR